jgi:hypothetical protein
MKLTIGSVLFALGLALALYGLWGALMPMAQMYDHALNNPMADGGPADDPKRTGAGMFNHAMLGIVGAVMCAVGGWLASLGVWDKVRKRRLARAGVHAGTGARV